MAAIIRPTDRAEAIVRLPADRPPRGRAIPQPPQAEPERHEMREPQPEGLASAPSDIEADLAHMGAVAAATLADTDGSLLDRAMKAAQVQAEEEIGRLREQARDEGYREGREQGERDAGKLWDERIASLGKVVESVQALRDEVLRDAEDKLVELVFEALGRILGQTLVTREGVTAVVRQVLNAARDQDKVLTLRVAPADLALLQQAERPADLLSGVVLVADPRVQLGGCLVDTAQGTIDGRLEIQLERLKDAVLEARHEPRR